MSEPNLIWSSVFLTGKLDPDEYRPEEKGSDRAKLIACNRALMAWNNCMRGERPPENFGWGMFALADWAKLSVNDLKELNAEAVGAAAIARMQFHAERVTAAAIVRASSSKNKVMLMDDDDYVKSFVAVCVLAILLTVCFCALIFWGMSVQCDRQWSRSGMQNEYDLVSGCMVQLKDKTWIPADKYREVAP